MCQLVMEVVEGRCASLLLSRASFLAGLFITLCFLDISTGQQIGFGDGGAGGAIVGDGKLEEMEVRMASV